MPSVNKVFLLGNLGQDPKMIKSEKTGTRFVTLSVATTDSWVNKKGDRQEQTAWHDCIVFGERLCDLILEYCKKGTLVWLEGALQYSEYVDQHGVQKSKAEIKVFTLTWLKNYKTLEDHQPEGSSQPAAATDEKPF
tara:strand:+ start:1349 stop:1756 length:408 start_codon:yes stop_codon:yes gene_type:complete